MLQYSDYKTYGQIFYCIYIIVFIFFFAPQALNQVSANHCTDPKPNSAPILTGAVAGEDSVTLAWIEAQDPVTYYLVAYGRSKTEIEYGNPNIGGRGTTAYTVGGLTRGIKYYFKVRAVNGCKPGKFSNKLSAVPGFRETFLRPRIYLFIKQFREQVHPQRQRKD